jgi:hypothetical protein
MTTLDIITTLFCHVDDRMRKDNGPQNFAVLWYIAMAFNASMMSGMPPTMPTCTLSCRSSFISEAD